MRRAKSGRRSLSCYSINGSDRLPMAVRAFEAAKIDCLRRSECVRIRLRRLADSLVFDEGVAVGHACQVIRYSARRALAFGEASKFARQKHGISHKLVKAFSQRMLSLAA